MTVRCRQRILPMARCDHDRYGIAVGAANPNLLARDTLHDLVDVEEPNGREARSDVTALPIAFVHDGDVAFRFEIVEAEPWDC